MLQFFLVVSLLRFKFHKFTLRINQSSLLVLKSEGLIVKHSIEIVNTSKSLRDIVLDSPNFCSIFDAFLALEINLRTQFIDFYGIVSVSFSELLEIVIKLFFLVIQRRVQVLLSMQISTNSCNLD